ncbi:MAG: glycosyltransferase [Alphaproteobacteria bacterium]|nr:glycosyltransferase [Alphaproteobacteria bacterium]
MSKILVSFPAENINGKYHFYAFYEGLITALKRNGNDVYYMAANEFIENYSARTNDISSSLDADKLDKYIKKINPDLVISFNNFRYKKLHTLLDCPFVVWGVDSVPFFSDKENLKQFPNRYLFFANNEEDIRPLRDAFNPESISLIRFATDIRASKKQQNKNISFIGYYWDNVLRRLLEQHKLTVEQVVMLEKCFRENPHYDIAQAFKLSQIPLDYPLKETDIIHSLSSTDRETVLLNLSDLDLHLYGQRWQFSQYSLASKFNDIPTYSIEQISDILNTSKISFNMSHLQATEFGFSFRLLDSMASNACLVTDYKKGYEQLFGKYVKLPTFEYGNPQDARKVCEYLLNHEDERLDIVKASQKAIDAEYRFEHRFKQIESVTNVKLFNKKQGKLTQICATDFKKEAPKTVVQVVTPQKADVVQTKKEKSLLKKILKFPKKLRIKRFKSVYKQYFLPFFTQLPKSMETGFDFCHRRFIDVLYRIDNGLTSPIYASYHLKLHQESYIAKVSRQLVRHNNNNKIRVVFLFQEASYWSSMKSLYETLMKDERFEVFVVAIPVLVVPHLNKLELKSENIKFLEDNNIEYIDARGADGTMFDIYNLKPDYVFVQIHFDRQRILEYKTNIIRLYSKVCLIPHAFLLSASDNKELSYQQDYFRIFAPNQYHAEQLSSVIHRSDNIEITGYPRFDLYNSHLQDSPIWKIRKKKKSRIKRIIWSPHWWAYGHSRGLANGVLNLWDYFYNYVQAHKDVELIVKPHPNLFNGLTQSGYITESKANSMIAAMNALPNAQVYMGGDYIDLFQTADLIVNNSISFLAEWLPSEKPMIFFDTERKFELNEMAGQILEVYYHVSSITALDEQITNILYKQQDSMKYQRINCCKKLNLKAGNVAEKIKQSLIEHVNDTY